VISCLFSGTKQIDFGWLFNAISIVSCLAAISRFNGTFILFNKFSRSFSFMCLLSSLRWTVIESAPDCSAILAAAITSG
jgi:hypothetical protein